MFIVCKLAVIAMVATVLAQSGSGAYASWKLSAHSFSEWFDMGHITKQTFTIVLALAMGLLLIIQVYIGDLMLSLANKYDSKIATRGCSNHDDTSNDVVHHDRQTPHQKDDGFVSEKSHTTEVVKETNQNYDPEKDDETSSTDGFLFSSDKSLVMKLPSDSGNVKRSISSLVVGDIQQEAQQPDMDNQEAVNADLAFAV